MHATRNDARLWVLGELLELRLTAEETDGAYGVVVETAARLGSVLHRTSTAEKTRASTS
jgi:hypothetical protein